MLNNPHDLIMTKRIFRSKIDILFVIILAIVVAAPLSMTTDPDTRIPGIILSLGMIILFIILIRGCWYEIDNNELIVYQFFRPLRIPISKIREVRKSSGYLATAGMSHKRVSIYFVDRSVNKSLAPIEISPKDRDAFISLLKEINPSIA